VDSPREVPEVLTSWEPDIEVAEMAVPNPPPDLATIDRQREQILAAAINRLGDPPRRLRHELGWLLDAVAATLLVDDPQLLVEFSAWQTSLLSGHGFPETTTADLSRALAGGLDDTAPTAARLLA
jgi:hypothetical protein